MSSIILEDHLKEETSLYPQIWIEELEPVSSR